MSPEVGPDRPLWGPFQGGSQLTAGTAVPPTERTRFPDPPVANEPTTPTGSVWPAVPPPVPPASPYPVPAPSPPLPPVGSGTPPAVASPPPAQPPAAGGDRRTVVVIAASVLVVMVVAGVVAVTALAGPGPAGSGIVTAAPPAVASAVPGAPARNTSPTASASTSAPGSSSPGGLVQMHPTAGSGVPVETQQVVLDLLDRHFAAINARDYSMWADTVVPRRAQDQPVGTWTDAYATTYDEAVTVSSLDPTGPDSVLVGLSFVSNQSAAHAPADLPVSRICWQTRWPVVEVSIGGQLGTPPPGTTTRRAC